MYQNNSNNIFLLIPLVKISTNMYAFGRSDKMRFMTNNSIENHWKAISFKVCCSNGELGQSLKFVFVQITLVLEKKTYHIHLITKNQTQLKILSQQEKKTSFRSRGSRLSYRIWSGTIGIKQPEGTSKTSNTCEGTWSRPTSCWKIC